MVILGVILVHLFPLGKVERPKKRQRGAGGKGRGRVSGCFSANRAVNRHTARSTRQARTARSPRHSRFSAIALPPGAFPWLWARRTCVRAETYPECPPPPPKAVPHRKGKKN